MPELHLPLLPPHTRSELTSFAIDQFLNANARTPTLENGLRGSVIISAVFTEPQLGAAQELLLMQGLDAPRVITFAKILPSTKDELSADKAKAQGFVYAALEYAGEVAMYGGVLGARGVYATHMRKRLVPLAGPDSPPDAAMPAGTLYTENHYLHAAGLRKFGYWCLTAVGINPGLEKITRAEFRLLRALATVE